MGTSVPDLLFSYRLNGKISWSVATGWIVWLRNNFIQPFYGLIQLFQ